MHINAKLLYFDSEHIMGKSFIIRVLHLLNILPCTLLILRIFTNLKIRNKFHRPCKISGREGWWSLPYFRFFLLKNEAYEIH